MLIVDIIISTPQTVDRFRRENIMIRLREIRMKCGFTQKELAKKISVSTNCIQSVGRINSTNYVQPCPTEGRAFRLTAKPHELNMWETGDRNPSISMLKKLAEVLGCTADKLLDTEWRE